MVTEVRRDLMRTSNRNLFAVALCVCAVATSACSASQGIALGSDGASGSIDHAKAMAPASRTSSQELIYDSQQSISIEKPAYSFGVTVSLAGAR